MQMRRGCPPVTVGDRLRLTAPMSNGPTSVIPVEDLPVGTEGTVSCIGQWSSELTEWIGVRWDNGSRLNLMPGDSFEVINE